MEGHCQRRGARRHKAQHGRQRALAPARAWPRKVGGQGWACPAVGGVRTLMQDQHHPINEEGRDLVSVTDVAGQSNGSAENTPEAVRLLREMIATRRTQAELLRAQLAEIEPELKRYERALALILDEATTTRPRPGQTERRRAQGTRQALGPVGRSSNQSRASRARLRREPRRVSPGGHSHHHSTSTAA